MFNYIELMQRIKDYHGVPSTSPNPNYIQERAQRLTDYHNRVDGLFARFGVGKYNQPDHPNYPKPNVPTVVQPTPVPQMPVEATTTPTYPAPVNLPTQPTVPMISPTPKVQAPKLKTPLITGNQG